MSPEYQKLAHTVSVYVESTAQDLPSRLDILTKRLQQMGWLVSVISADTDEVKLLPRRIDLRLYYPGASKFEARYTALQVATALNDNYDNMARLVKEYAKTFPDTAASGGYNTLLGLLGIGLFGYLALRRKKT